MAVPPIQPTRAVTAGPAGLVRTLGASVLLDVVLGLLVAVALPLAIVAIPNTISVVASLLPPGISQIEMMRAHGLALPAMMLTVPLAAVAVRRMRAAPLLIAGLTVLALADAAGGYANSTLLVGVLRVLHGIGAGLLVPATLVAVWERPLILRAVWGAMLAASLLAAQALALWPLDEVRSWKVTLQPYPMLTGVALTLAAVYLILWMRSGGSAVAGPGPSDAERGRLLMAAVPAVGIAALALGTTFDWPPELLVPAAALSIVALFALASAGAFEGAGGRASAYTMLAVGVVVLPTAAQVTYVELGGLGGPGLSGLWHAFVIAGVFGLLAAWTANRLGDAAMPLVAAGGLVIMVAGLCSVRLLLPAADGPALIFPFALLAVGAAAALASALRSPGAGTALFALSLFFPGVLSGFLLGSGIQVVRLNGATTPQALVDAFVDALHLWALIGGGLVVMVIVLGALLARRAPAAVSGTAGATVSDAVSPDEPSPVEGRDDARAEKPHTASAPTGEMRPVAAPQAVVKPDVPVAGPKSALAPAVPEPATELEPMGTEIRFPRESAASRTTPVAKTGSNAGQEAEEGDEPAGHDDPEPGSEPERIGTLPVVPPPTPSPEDELGDGPARA
ncbi:hypothetical protein [Streptosporangium sp. NPDC000396]|uniref:hypothetical protein n=1 Tax=Streptosporangium sp. NPDC000396 TaxID=3366185 RepID=UPI003690CA9E